ncbi:MAG: tetratricopeptide repeat protein [Acidobacteriaceae bacterium]|nr:tetratricopeptide repeat protein [Acidobacteriaceae bacterium]
MSLPVTAEPPVLIEEWEVLDLLTSLVDKSLVVYEEDERGVSRYRLLETVRQYAHDHLVASDQSTAARDRHRDWFALYAEQSLVPLCDTGSGWDQVEFEYPNLLAALEWCVAEKNCLDATRRLLMVLSPFWDLHGRVSEGRQVCSQLLAMSKTKQATGTTLALMLEAGNLANLQQDYALGRALLEEALYLGQESRDTFSAASALHYLGHATLMQGDLPVARSYFEQSLRLQQDLGQTAHMPHILLNLGHIARFEQRFDRARGYYDEAIARCREQDPSDHLILAHPFMNLGHVARLTGNFTEAQRCYRESLHRFVDVDARSGIAYNLEGLACLAASMGAYSRAPRLFGAADALRQAIQTPVPPVDRASYADALQATRSTLGDETFEIMWAQGHAMTLEQAVEYALEDGAEP